MILRHLTNADGRDPAQASKIPPEQRPGADQDPLRNMPWSSVLLKDGRPQLIVLPVHGRGFGSTLYGLYRPVGRHETVIGLGFYEHGETPGLGALIDEPAWRRLWSGKRFGTSGGEVGLGVARGPVVPGTPEARIPGRRTHRRHLDRPGCHQPPALLAGRARVWALSEESAESGEMSTIKSMRKAFVDPLINENPITLQILGCARRWRSPRPWPPR